MKQNIKNMIKMGIMAMLCVAFVVTQYSCSDDDSVTEPDNIYVQFGERVNNEDVLLSENYLLEVARTESSNYYYFMYTNIQKWTLSAKGEGDMSWVRFFPNEGEKDGRFYFAISENKTLEERNADIMVTASNGKATKLFSVKQAAAIRALWFTPASKTIDSKENIVSFVIETNTAGWELTGYDEKITVMSVDKTTGRVVVKVPANDAVGAVERKLIIYINSTDSPVIEKTFTITQKYPGQS